MTFDVVVAHDLNRGIGCNNELPWQCSTDMKHFKTLTIGTNETMKNTVIMGRKTWESLPETYRPLPNRDNIVLSKTITEISGASVAHSLDHALEMANPNASIFVIGGAQIYQEALAHPACHTLHVTKIFKRCECDAFFPDYDTFKCTYASNIWINKLANCAFFRYQKQK